MRLTLAAIGSVKKRKRWKYRYSDSNNELESWKGQLTRTHTQSTQSEHQFTYAFPKRSIFILFGFLDSTDKLPTGFVKTCCGFS